MHPIFRFLPDPHPFQARPPQRVGTCLAAWLGLAACAPEATAPHEGSLRSAHAEPVQISLGESTTCATLSSGAVKCWGRADAGRLGLGRALDPTEPEPSGLESIALSHGATMVATNGTQSFVRLDDGTVQAFGPNGAYELGLLHTATIGDDETPAAAPLPTAVRLSGPALEVAAGKGFACALLGDGRVQCWGRGDEGQLGRGILPGTHPPADVILGGTAVELAVGVAHACARLSQGSVRCWGLDHEGQLGLGGAVASAPVPASTGDVVLGGVATQVVAGGHHTCALLDQGELRCWGANHDGQLGHGHTQSIGDDEPPAAAGDVRLGGAALQVAAGLRHTCALLDQGELRCWGDGSHGQLGLPAAPRVGDDEAPADVDPVDMGGVAVASVLTGALAEHTCALLDDGRLRCWGRNDHGQVGLGYASPQDPVEGPPGDLPDVIIVEDPDA